MRIDGLIEDFGGAIFDMDGLLVNSERLYWQANIEVAKRENLGLPDDAYLTLAGASYQTVEKFYHEHFPSRAAVQRFIKDTDDLVFQWAKAGKLHLNNGVLATLEFFKRHQIKMGVASSNYPDAVQLFLSLTKIKDNFDFILTSEDITKPKPEPDVYLKAQELMGLPKTQILIFEDSPTGILAAKNAGIKSVLVPDIVNPTAPQRRRASMVVTSFTEFLQKISK